MRKRAETITLDDVKDTLRRGRNAEIRNCGGWSVFAVEGQVPRFIVDGEDNFRPIPYASVKTLSVAMKRHVRGVAATV